MWYKSLVTAAMCFCLALPASAETKPDNGPFPQWLKGIQEKAREQGISEATVALLDDLERDPRVIKFDRRQPEFTQTFEEYLTARVTQYRIDKGRKYYRENKAQLEEIAKRYDVDAPYLVAFWGLESNFGQYQGKYSIIRSLATLGHDPKRTTFFTRELMTSLKILDEGHIEPEKFVGGWAGAMGQNQFMPSSFLNYAEDFDGDGRKNIWGNQVDVWASIANYLQKNRWRMNSTWGSKVELTETIDFATLKPESTPKGCRAYRHHTQALTLEQWQAKGVVVEKELDDSRTYAMVVPDEGESRAYLVGPNFRGILAYNCANKYAVSVGMLADLIASDQS